MTRNWHLLQGNQLLEACTTRGRGMVRAVSLGRGKQSNLTGVQLQLQDSGDGPEEDETTVKCLGCEDVAGTRRFACDEGNGQGVRSTMGDIEGVLKEYCAHGTKHVVVASYARSGGRAVEHTELRFSFASTTEEYLPFERSRV